MMTQAELEAAAVELLTRDDEWRLWPDDEIEVYREACLNGEREAAAALLVAQHRARKLIELVRAADRTDWQLVAQQHQAVLAGEASFELTPELEVRFVPSRAQEACSCSVQWRGHMGEDQHEPSCPLS